MIKGIIFDFDGVIIDSVDIQRQAFHYAHKQLLGYTKETLFEEYLLHSGDSLKNIICKMGLPKEFENIYKNVSRQKVGLTKFHEGIKEVLDELKNEGYKLILFTGKDRTRTIEILEYGKMNGYFDMIVCSDDIENAKPHPEGINLIRKTMQLEQDECVMIGDAANDIQSAENAGISSIAVSWGEYPYDKLISLRPSYIVDKPSEILNCIYSLISEKRKY